jgi:hypothetical protein
MATKAKAMNLARSWLAKTRDRAHLPNEAKVNPYKHWRSTRHQLPKVLITRSLHRFNDTKLMKTYVRNEGDSNVATRVRNGRMISEPSTNIDTKWIQQQVEYIQNLSFDDLLTAAAYTVQSSEWIGPWQRSNGKVPNIFHKEEIADLVKQGMITNENMNNFNANNEQWAVHRRMEWWNGGNNREHHVTPLYPQMRNVVGRMGKNAFIRSKLADPSIAGALSKFMNTEEDAGSRYKAYRNILVSRAFKDEALKAALQAFERAMSRIIRGAPPVPKGKVVVVYRGDTGTVFSKIGAVIATSSFMSTSLNLNDATEYAVNYSESKPPYFEPEYKTIHRFVLQPGARALFIAPLNIWEEDGQTEVVLNKGAILVFKSRNVKRWVRLSSGRFVQMNFNDIYVY